MRTLAFEWLWFIAALITSAIGWMTLSDPPDVMSGVVVIALSAIAGYAALAVARFTFWAIRVIGRASSAQ
jgi:hypothetical protein